MAKGWVTLNVREEIKQKLQGIYSEDRKRPQNQKFTSWLDNLLFELVGHYERLREYGAFLEIENLTENHVLVMDRFQGKHFFVHLPSKSNHLFCEQDASTTCLHVGFCLATPQVFKALIKMGFVPVHQYREMQADWAPDALRELKKSLKRPTKKKDHKSIHGRSNV